MSRIGFCLTVTYFLIKMQHVWEHIRSSFTPQPSGLEWYCHTRLLGGQLPDSGELISLKLLDGYSLFEVLWICLDLQWAISWSVAHLSYMGWPRAKNLSNQVPPGSRLCRTHISETAGWIYTEVLWNCLNLYLCNIMGLWPRPWISKVKCWKAIS